MPTTTPLKNKKPKAPAKRVKKELAKDITAGHLASVIPTEVEGPVSPIINTHARGRCFAAADAFNVFLLAD